MTNQNSFPRSKDNYDPRWFIWTIVFLLVTGISLVSYIMLSDTSSADDGSPVVAHSVIHKK
jgi:hypothetical protein